MKQPSRELVDAFFAWYEADPHAQNEDAYAGKVTPEALDALSPEAFIEFFFQFAHEGGKVQSGGHRTAPMLRRTIEDNHDAFHAFVMDPPHHSLPPDRPSEAFP